MSKELKPAKILFYIFLIAPFFQLELLENLIPFMGKAYTLWQLLAGAAFAAMWVSGKGKIRDFSWIHLLFAALLAVMVIGTLMNPEASLKRALEYSYGSLAVGIITEYSVKKDRENFLTGMEMLFGTLVTLNVVTILLFPKGMYSFERALEENWLLGYKNYHIVYIMALLIFSAVHSLCKTGKIGMRVWLYIAISAFSSILVKARTPLMAIALFAAAILFKKLLEYTGIFNALTYLALYAAAFVAIVVIRVENLPIIGKLIGREVSFNNRIHFWDKAMTQFRDYPIFGHGYQQFRMFRGYVTTHNQMIEVLFKTGVVGFVFFCAILVAAAVMMFRSRKGACTRYLAVLYASYLILFLLEQYAFANYFFLFVLACDCGLLDKFTSEVNSGNLPPETEPEGELTSGVE